jgi:hypothetical protein
MTTKNPTPIKTLFWDLAQQLFLEHPTLTEGRIMSHPCLRINGNFVAMTLTTSDGIVIKLPAERVHQLIQAGQGQPFIPNGKVFKEWLHLTPPNPAAPSDQAPLWLQLLQESIQFNQ